MYTREQLEALRIKLHERAEEARVDGSKSATAFNREFYYGKEAAYEIAASHVLALIESQEEVTA